MNENLPGGFIKTYGLYHNGDQIGFQCFAEYTPWGNKNKKRLLHSNRVVLNPDYVGFGLGIKMVNAASQLLYEEGYNIMTKLSSIPMYKAHLRDDKWMLRDVGLNTQKAGKNITRKTGYRKHVKWWSFVYIGKKEGAEAPPISEYLYN